MVPLRFWQNLIDNWTLISNRFNWSNRFEEGRNNRAGLGLEIGPRIQTGLRWSFYKKDKN